MASPEIKRTQVEEVFNPSTWQEQANKPGALERLGQQWDAFLATKGQGVQAYLADLQLAYRCSAIPSFRSTHRPRWC